jgi:hypothetical protein
LLCWGLNTESLFDLGWSPSQSLGHHLWRVCEDSKEQPPGCEPTGRAESQCQGWCICGPLHKATPLSKPQFLHL